MYPSRRLLQQIPGHLPSAPPPEPLAVDSDIVVILAALLCALICVVGLALVARCAWLRRSSSAPPPAPPNKGLKKKVLRSLPRVAFQPGAVDHARFADCAICLAEFAEGDEIRVLPQCGHGFHAACVDMWLASHSSCPSCRQILVSGAMAAAVTQASARCEKCGASSGPPAAALGEASRTPPEDMEAGTVTGVVTGTKSGGHGDAHSFLP